VSNKKDIEDLENWIDRCLYEHYDKESFIEGLMSRHSIKKSKRKHMHKILSDMLDDYEDNRKYILKNEN
jgi:hypothetical protein